jgi:hypothetical protein
MIRHATIAVAALLAACSSGNDRSAFGNGQDPNGLGGDGTGLGNPGGSTDGEKCAAESINAVRAEVDIIVVIDTSGSMGEETAQVKQNINTFASKIGSTGLDYNVVMIAEKEGAAPGFPGFPGFPGIPMPGICVPQPLAGASCADNPPKFHHLAESVGSTDSLQIILDKFPTYSPWLRPSAYKVFIEVTDDNSALDWQSFDTQLLAKSSTLFGTSSQRKYIFDTIAGWQKGSPILSANKCGSAVNTGDQYQHLSQETNGIVGSVCETDYSGVFDNIAKGLITTVGCEFNYPTKSANGIDTDPTTVVVNYTAGGGTPSPLTQVTDASKCGTVANAWYYNDNANPTKIVFCPATCDAAGKDTAGKIDIAVGCKAPPPK